MKIEIKLDTERAPWDCVIIFDGVKQGLIQSLVLDMDTKGINDFRLKRLKGRDGRAAVDLDGRVEGYVESLSGSAMVVAEGQ